MKAKDSGKITPMERKNRSFYPLQGSKIRSNLLLATTCCDLLAQEKPETRIASLPGLLWEVECPSALKELVRTDSEARKMPRGVKKMSKTLPRPPQGTEQKQRYVKQLQFTTWPDHSVPEAPGSLLAFVELVREQVKVTQGKGPILVHCR